MSNSRLFDLNYTDCNDCSNYWNNSCDGVKIGEEKICRSFIATKRIEVLQEMAKLKKHVRLINILIILQSLLILIESFLIIVVK